MLARLDPEGSAFETQQDGFDLVLAISQPVPYRVATQDNPRRLIVDFSEVDFAKFQDGQLGYTEAVEAVRFGPVQAGWSRLIIDLAGPFAVESAEMAVSEDDGSARIRVALRQVDPAVFSARSAPEAAQSFPDPAGDTSEPGR